MTSLIVALMLVAPPAEKVWLQGHLLAFNTSHWVDGATVSTRPDGYGGSRSTVNRKNWVTYYYTLEVTMDGQPMIVQAANMPHSVFSHVPNVIENDTIQYRVEGRVLFVLDRDHKEIKCRIVKMRKP